jgi:hypothetical protein
MKVCNFYKIKSINQLFHNNDFNQTSNVFSYFILKGFYNTDSINILKILPHIKISNSYNCKNNSCNPITEFTQKLFNDKLNNFFFQHYFNLNENSTLRMTLFSIK